MKNYSQKCPFCYLTWFDSLILSLKLIFFLNFLIFLAILKIIFSLLSLKVTRFIPVYFHKLVLWLVNIEVKIEGKILKKQGDDGILLVSNHISYIDIPVLGSLVPINFVAKEEVKNWALIGILAKIGSTIFVKRSKDQLLKEKNSIQKVIDNGGKVILFPEGTTSDGTRVLNFKSSLFSSVENKDYCIQPVVINYKKINGLPINRWLKPMIAWYGDMEFKPHLIKMICLGSIIVKVNFLKPVNARQFKNRKSMTLFLQSVIYNHYSKNIN